MFKVLDGCPEARFKFSAPSTHELMPEAVARIPKSVKKVALLVSDVDGEFPKAASLAELAKDSHATGCTWTVEPSDKVLTKVGRDEIDLYQSQLQSELQSG